jgi:hypothetical protein
MSAEFATELAPGLAYDAKVHFLIVDGVQISPELIKEAWTREGQRKLVIFEASGEIHFLSSRRDGDVVQFTRHEPPGPSWLPGRDSP